MMEHFLACNNLDKFENLENYFYRPIDYPLVYLSPKSQHHNSIQRGDITSQPVPIFGLATNLGYFGNFGPASNIIFTAF